MPNYERLLKDKFVNAVIYFSPTGGTEKIAKYAANYLNTSLISLTTFKEIESFSKLKRFNYLVFCFPVYSENITTPLKKIIANINANYLILLATYGKMGTGNILNEVKKKVKAAVIGGAYIPTKHTYKESSYFNDYQSLNGLLNKVINKEVKEITFPKQRKHLFASFFPHLRSKLGVKIIRTEACVNCGICDDECPVKAINNGKINADCIRCLRCYYKCPNQGLEVKYSFFLRRYLKKDKVIKLIIFEN
ncbi:MAG: 4Fe-4S binding protein [Acholeplasmataceae bacterium]|jgi:ferredoxin|nr:4Fe-4S binding protein [Acholeplasmataceae bacterium]MCK9234631.1 4Fe-4S binding protein [Acholeplasmataceae bacterium]